MISYKGKNKRTVNLLKMMYFDYPEWVPSNVSFLPATWIKYREKLEDVLLAHPKVFPGYRKGSTNFDAVHYPTYELGRHTDRWGCVWENIEQGMEAAVVVHPLDDWSKFDAFKWPDPLKDDAFGPRQDWNDVKKWMGEEQKKGNLASGGGLEHGFMYMKLYYLRGFDNFMLDMAMDEPKLYKLIDKIVDYNVTVVKKYLDMGAEYIVLGEDLGLQKSLPMSPEMWRKFIKPCYEKIIGQCRDRGIPVYLHSDGHILEIIPDLIEVGVTVLNPQIRANGLEGLVSSAKGKVALHQDMDRQMFPFVKPKEIEKHFQEVFNGLFMEKGGLSISAECGPDVPLENIDTVCIALEKLCNLPPADVT